MKKFLMVLSIFMVIGLSSCSSGAKREIIRDNPENSLKEALKLDSVSNGKSINKDVDKTKAYYDVLVAEDVSSTVFYQTIDLDEYINERLKQININTLYFTGKIPTTDVTSFLGELNNKDYGLNDTNVGFSFKKTEGLSSTLYGNLSLKYSVVIPNGYNIKANDPTKLIVAYVPVYCIYNDGSQDYTKVYMLVPVYYAFTYSSESASYTSGLANYQLKLTESGLLPSQTE